MDKAASPSKATATLVLERGAGTEACLSQKLLEKSVEQRLRRRVFVEAGSGTPALRLRVRFLKQDTEFQARIELSSWDHTARGERLLVTSSRHCSALDDSLALSLAILVDSPPEPLPPEIAIRPEAPRRSPERPPAASPIAIPEDAEAPREPWRLALTPGARVSFGALPGIASGFSLGARLGTRHFPTLLVEGDLWPARNAPRDAVSGARFRMARAGIFLCPALGSGPRHSWGFCLGQEVGWLRVDGYGFDRNLQGGGLTYALAARGEASLLVVAPVSVRGFLGAEVPLVRDRFVSAGSGAREVFRPQPLAILAGIGAELAVW